MNKKLPDYFLGKFELAMTMIFSICFASIFLSVCAPLSTSSWFDLGNSELFVFMAVFILISLLFLSVSRVLMYFSKHWFQMTYFIYVIWCLLEEVMVCVLYTILTIFVIGSENIQPGQVLRSSIFYGSFALIIPYTICGMYLSIIDKNKTIRILTSRRALQGNGGSAGDDRISLYDSGGVLRLSVKSSNLYFIESDDNYIKVWYSDGKTVPQMRMIRCRLKTIEDNFRGTSLVRCNRKYIVNTDRVKVLTKESDGYYLDMGCSGIPLIAVTKTYRANILSRFSAK